VADAEAVTDISNANIGAGPPRRRSRFRPERLSRWSATITILAASGADGELKELTLREPTAGDLAQAGVPVVIDFSGDARAERRSSQEE
jgi:hypothetical protein